ncbi:MAG: hypothetical protein Q9192_002660 [Flavoplaca navasiana]
MAGKHEKGEYHPSPRATSRGELGIQLPDNHTEQKSNRQDAHAADSQGSSDDLREGGNDLPDPYQNLDEVEEPGPVELPDIPKPQGYLEDRLPNTAQPDDRRIREDPSVWSTDPDTAKRPSLARRQHVTRLATEFYTISYLIFFSILGTLARLGLQALTFYPGAPVATGVLWANVAGSFILGFLAQDRKLFGARNDTRPPSTSFAQPSPSHRDQEQTSSLRTPQQGHASVKTTIPLYIGLSTGFCGSLTSFSSFIRDVFLALANALPVPISHTSASPTLIHRSGGYSFMAFLAVIITTVALSISALIVGAQLAVGVERYTPSITYPFARRFLDRATVFLGWGSWLGAIILAIWPPDQPTHTRKSEHWRGAALFAIVFAPLGCLSRFYISLMLNSRIKSFPLGTFVVNILGTALEGVFWDLQHSSDSVQGGVVGCQVLQGMMDGFCGAATTVSTWVGELNGLRRRHAWVYGGVSVAVGVAIMIGVMGGVLWGKGWNTPVCMR